MQFLVKITMEVVELEKFQDDDSFLFGARILDDGRVVFGQMTFMDKDLFISFLSANPEFILDD